MIILGIHDGHNASASLIIDGKLTCALGEERLSKGKHHYGYPSMAIQTRMATEGQEQQHRPALQQRMLNGINGTNSSRETTRMRSVLGIA